MGETAYPGKQPRWQNTKVSAVKEGRIYCCGTVFQPVPEALGRIAGYRIIPAVTARLLWLTVHYPGWSAATGGTFLG